MGIKIEIGSGEYPREGYFHFDIRSGLPDLDCIADVLCLPIKTGSVNELLAVQILEHVSWIDAPSVLSECHRVLVLGGLFRCYTPDMRFLARELLKPDRDFRLLINWVYGGRNYEENWHKGGFDKSYMQGLLDDIGFAKIEINDEAGLYVEAVK